MHDIYGDHVVATLPLEPDVRVAGFVAVGVMSVETGMCDGLSMAMRVHGVGAHLFEESAPNADAGTP